MIANIIVQLFISIIAGGIIFFGLLTWLNFRQNQELDQVYRGEKDSRTVLRYAMHRVR